MLNILDLTKQEDIDRLRQFSQLDHPSTFRYFKNRVFEEAIQTHILTILYSTYAYAHIDYDRQSDRYYLGVCVMPEQQGRGIGRTLVSLLLKLFDKDIYLTVDKDNTRAIRLYESFGFECIENREMNVVYRRLKSLQLDVSVGEGIDKLTILDIKIEKISNTEKRQQCIRERNSMVSRLEPYIQVVPRYYTWLKYINTQIWDVQDSMREVGEYSNENFNKILDLNDMRFRVKQRINATFSSSLREQKGYSNKAGIFVSHLGMGDVINMNGAIRYAALMVDKLYVICLPRYYENTREMFEDDPWICVVPCEDFKDEITDLIANERKDGSRMFKEPISHRFLSGFWIHNDRKKKYDDIPNDFYEDLKFPREIRKLFAHFHTRNLLPVPPSPYIFTHSTTSTTNPLKFTWNPNEILTIDPNRNYYSVGHKWYELAEQYVNKPILSYINVMKQANEIHVTDSSFYCLGYHLDLKMSTKICYDRVTCMPSTKYKFD